MKSSWRSPDGESSVAASSKIEPCESAFCAWGYRSDAYPEFSYSLRRGVLGSSFAECCVRPPARPHTCSTLALCDQNLEQPVEVGLGRLHKHPSGAACSDSYRKLPSGVRPALHRLPVHAAQLRERASQRVEHHRDCGAELGTHPRHLVWHVHRSLEVDQASVTVELASGYDALNIE